MWRGGARGWGRGGQTYVRMPIPFCWPTAVAGTAWRRGRVRRRGGCWSWCRGGSAGAGGRGGGWWGGRGGGGRRGRGSGRGAGAGAGAAGAVGGAGPGGAGRPARRGRVEVGRSAGGRTGVRG